MERPEEEIWLTAGAGAAARRGRRAAAVAGGRGHGDLAGAAADRADRGFLDGLVVGQRRGVVENRLDLVVTGRGEVALGLHDLEAGREADGELLLFRFELALRQLARGAGGVDTLQVRVDAADHVANLLADAHLHLTHLQLALVVLELRACEAGLGVALANRVGDGDAEAPARIRGAEHVTQHAAVAAR